MKLTWLLACAVAAALPCSLPADAEDKPDQHVFDKLIATQPVSGAQIIGVGEHVDYWDRLGWKDRFSSAAVTGWQQGYQARLGNESTHGGRGGFFATAFAGWTGWGR